MTKHRINKKTQNNWVGCDKDTAIKNAVDLNYSITNMILAEKREIEKRGKILPE